MKDKVIRELESEKINEYRPLPFWSWNDDLQEEKLVKQIERMKNSGCGGYFMHARGGLKTEYMGDKWFSCIKACAEAGKRLGMQSWAYDENGWPSGFAGGKLLENEEYRDRFLTRGKGDFDKKAYASFLITENELIFVRDEGEAERAKTELAKGSREKGSCEKASCANGNCANGSCASNAEFLNVYLNVSASTADILNEKVVKKFLEYTHEEYKKRLGKSFAEDIKGFFTDEPQYYMNGQPYSTELERYFKEKYGEDVKERIGLLYEEKEGYREFRYKFWSAMHELMLSSYAKQVYKWCEDNGVMLTGHYLEESSLFGQMMCCAGITSFYEYEHMIGIDWLGRRTDTPVTPRQASSVARQLGRKKVIGEIYAMCGWDVTPRELKTITEWLFVYGVNVICQHLVPYSEHGQRKRDYPAHYSEYNPWVKKDFKSFNDYFARLGYLLGESEEIVSVGLFSPVSSMYFDYKQGVPKTYDADRSYLETALKLGRANVPFHILDEKIMEGHGRVEGKELVVGNCRYKFVILPKTLTLSDSSAKLFEEFYAAGGKILFAEGVPEYLKWEKHDYAMKSNISFEEIALAQPYRIGDANTEIASTLRRTKEGKEFIFATNVSLEKSYTAEFAGNFKGFIKVDLETLKTEKVDTRLNFNAGDSYVLFLSEERAEEKEEKRKLVLSGEFGIENSSENYMLLDKPRYSENGSDYGERTRYMGIFEELLNKRYNGKLYLKYEFEVKALPAVMKFGYEDMNVEALEINGEAADNAVFDETEERYYADITNKVKIGTNEAVLKINFYESERTYYALFGEGVTETLKNCIAYETTVEACLLKGEFGVYSSGGFTDGTQKNVLIAKDDFFVGEPSKKVTNTVKEGYPFFAGNMTFVKEFEWDGGDCILDLSGRYSLCYLEINGKAVPKSYFGKSADISEFVQKGKNRAEITLYASNRNLLGPHCLADSEECILVGPFSWELQGSWKNGKSDRERESYSFVKFGLFGD